MEQTKKRGWKEFFGLIFKSKLPWTLYILGTLFTIGSTAISLAMPKYVGSLFEGNIFDDTVVRNYILLSISSTIVIAIATLFFSITPAVTKRNVQRTVWTKIINMKMKDYSRQPSQQLISRVTEDPRFIDNVLQWLKTVLTSTISLVGSYLIMYSMNPKLTFALLPVVPYILIVSAIVGHFTQKTQAGVQAQFSGITAFFAERLPRIKMLKSFTKEEEEMENGRAVLVEQYKAERKRAVVDLYAEPLMQSTRAIVIGIVLVYGSYLQSIGELKVSQVISFYLYVQFIHTHVLQYGLFWQNLKASKGASDKIADILDSESEKLEREQPIKDEAYHDISFENVSFGYGEEPVLTHLNFTIPAGKTTALVGPSGCGKSTTFKLIERFYEPDAGSMKIGNLDTKNIHLDDWRRSIASVSQSSPLLSGSIRDNITYGLDREVTIEELRNAAQLADALTFIEEFPEGFETEVGEFGTKLSGGQRQRIAIARAFIQDAPILLLDEATSSLDAESEDRIEKSLKILMEGRTTVIISHDMNFIRESDQIVVIDQGSVNGVGTHKELYETNELYNILVTIQSDKDNNLSHI